MTSFPPILSPSETVGMLDIGIMLIVVNRCCKVNLPVRYVRGTKVQEVADLQGADHATETVTRQQQQQPRSCAHSSPSRMRTHVTNTPAHWVVARLRSARALQRVQRQPRVLRKHIKCRIRSPHQGTLCLFCKSDKSLLTYSVRCPSPLVVHRTNRQNKAPLPLIAFSQSKFFCMNRFQYEYKFSVHHSRSAHVFSLMVILSPFFNIKSIKRRMFIGFLEYLRV